MDYKCFILGLSLKQGYGSCFPAAATVVMKSITMLYLEGQGDLVSRLITPITHIVPPVIRIINLLTKSP